MFNLKNWAGGLASRRSAAAMLGTVAAGAALWLLSTLVDARWDGAQAAEAAPADSRLVRLMGHVHRLAQARYDIGEAPDALEMGGLELVLAKTAAQKKALAQLLAAQQEPTSPQYHHWLTPAQYGSRFGASAAHIAALTQWLEANGFTVDAVPASRSTLRFHGSKTQVEDAFHTQIHQFDIRGVRHFANVTPPQVPAALAPLITEIRGLHDFYPEPGIGTRPLGQPAAQPPPHSNRAPDVQPQISYDGGKHNFVGPTDFATIYNLLPLYAHGIDGSNVTIAIGGKSDIDASIATAFWTGFGLARSPPQPIVVPTAAGGTDPGRTMDGNEAEAYLDVEAAGALAPGATIFLVRDKNVLIAAEYVIQNNLADILNLSFSACEENLAAANQAISSLFQQAASQGITVIVSSGDNGVAGCDNNVFKQSQVSTSGYAVNGIASTPYDLAVGGTDFDPTQPQDWGASNAPGTLANAQGHMPEMVWNNSCANPILATSLGFADPVTFCNTQTLNGQPNPFIRVAGGGGGQSSCTGLNNNACAGGYAQPGWQTGVLGIQGLSTRAVPDVAMIANHWVICSYDHPVCDPSNPADVDIAQGTSAAAPAVAAIIALLDQALKSREGLINPALYKLAAAEYGSPQSPSATLSSCNASLGVGIGAGCIFYNVTAGSNATPCQVSAYNQTGTMPASTCTAPSGEANGIMEAGGSAQYLAGTGFNLATGLGSINAANLVLALALPAPTGLTASTAGQTVKLAWGAELQAASFNVYQGTQPGQEGANPVQTGVMGTSTTVTGLQYGQSYAFTIAAVSALGVSMMSNEAQATTVPAAPTSLTATAGNGTVMLSWTAASGATSYSIYQGTSSRGEGTTPVQTGLTVTASTVTGLTNGTTYYFTVTALDAGGASAASAEASVMPTAPSGGGGGTVDSLELGLLAMLAGLRRARRACRSRGQSFSL